MSAEEAPGWSVYVLWSDTGRRFYTGLSEDVEHRLAQHNAGFSRWTARYAPWRCVFLRAFPTLTEARRFENLLKRQKGGQGFYRATGLSAQEYPRSTGS